MAKLEGFGGLRPRGKSGGFTFYELDGETIMRKLPSGNHRNKTHPTPLQLLNRQRFRDVNAFLKPIKVVLNFGFQNQSTKSKKGIHCAFGHLVHQAFSYGQDPNIDPIFLKISEGPLLAPHEAKAIRNGNLIELGWNDQVDQGSTFMPDYCMILVLNPETRKFYWFKEAGTRAGGKASISLSANDLGKNWCVYLAFYRKKADGSYLFSDSRYLGKV